MAKLHGIMEYRFVDPRTIVDGKDARGWEVDRLITDETKLPEGSPPTTNTWAGFMVEMAERHEKYAIWCEREVLAHGRIHDRHSTVHMDLGDVPSAKDPCPRCQEIAADARSATRTAERCVLARIKVP